MTFGTRNVSVFNAQDRVCFVGKEDSDLCEIMKIMPMSETDGASWRKYAFDGLLGLGLPELANSPQHSVSDTFGLFSILLSDHHDNTDNFKANVNELIFGGWREEYLDGGYQKLYLIISKSGWK